MRCPVLTKPPTEWKDLNFKVTPDFHHEFKTLAVSNRITNVELMRRMFDLFKRVNPEPSKH